MTNENNEVQLAAYVGFDWADQKHVIRIQAAHLTEIEADEVEQRPEALAEWVAKMRERFRDGKIAIGIEQTRGAVVYHLMQYEFLELYPINPKTLAKYREAFNVNKASCDQTDAELLLELVRVHRDRLRRWVPDDRQTRLLSMLVENRRKLINTVTEYTNRLTSLLKNYYPQALEMAGCLSTQMACDFLSNWPTLELLKAADSSELRGFYRKHGSVRKEVIEKRFKIVSEAQPLTTDEAIVEMSVMMAKAIVRQLRGLNESVQEFDERIAELFAEHPYGQIFDSFPGAGKVLAPRLTAAFGTNMNRYCSASDVQEFSGIAPVTEQSGKSKWVHRRYASPKFLKQTYHEFAGHSIHWSVWAKAYYDQQRELGKGHHAAVRALAFKWIRILFRCWKTNRPYDEQIYLDALARRGSPLVARLQLAASQN
ncbi:MAG: IS110 family transposase [Terriglobia bacterium]